MDQANWVAKSPHQGLNFVFGRITGNTTNPPLIPADGANNGIASTTRSGVGVYTVTFKRGLTLPKILYVDAQSIAANVECAITAVTPGTATTGMVIGISTRVESGSAVELGVSETVQIMIIGRDSLS